MGLFLNPDDVQLRDDRCNPFYIDKSLIISELISFLKQMITMYVYPVLAASVRPWRPI